MVCQNAPSRKPRVTPGTNHHAQQARALAGISVGSQTGNTPGTAGNRNKAFCSQCSRSKSIPGTATSSVVADCSRCSRCDPGQQQVARSNGPTKSTPQSLSALGAFVRQSPPTTTHAETGSTSNLPAAQWLELLAAVLGCSPNWLLESGRVDANDLAERARISDAARLIRSHEWAPPHPQPSPAPTTEAGATEAAQAAWLMARDAYLGHLMACRNCRAHLLKCPTHCPAGAELRAQYDQQTTHPLTSTLETPHA